jgi:hypothetical protein
VKRDGAGGDGLGQFGRGFLDGAGLADGARGDGQQLGGFGLGNCLN